jgi:hypothetical protein
MELPPSNRIRGWLRLGTDELTGRAHSQAFVGVDFVVVFDPDWELLENSSGIGPGVDAGVVALQGLHEWTCFGKVEGS